MKRTLRLIALCVSAVILITVLAACSSSTNEISTAYPDKAVGFQLEAPTVGEKIAIMHTSMGDISIRLFPEAAPKAVQNFITHAQNGYYNGLTFHRVVESFMIQGGDPDGDSTGGESIWKTPFEDEFDQKLLNLRGALAMANSGVNTNGSQFFINQGDAEAFGSRENYMMTKEQRKSAIDYYESQYQSAVQSYGSEMVEAYYGSMDEFVNSQLPPYNDELIPDTVWDLYEKNGGNVSLDGAWRETGGHTVFGHVFRGMDVVDAIAAVAVDDNDKPETAVTITSIEITTYQG